MTTHSMEEADSLGDRIGIMGAGKLLCLGTSTLLKSTYGNGYRLNISVEDGHLPAVHERVKSELGTCTLMSTENDGEPGGATVAAAPSTTGGLTPALPQSSAGTSSTRSRTRRSRQCRGR